MNERKYESTFIPCGDALEKMDLFADDNPAEVLVDEKKDETAKADLKDS